MRRANRIEFEDIDEIDKEDFIPNKQILCYPVIGLNKDNYYVSEAIFTNPCSKSPPILKEVYFKRLVEKAPSPTTTGK